MLLHDLYDVIELKAIDDTTLFAAITIDKTHELFKGHFPDNPVMPGVSMLQIIKTVWKHTSKHHWSCILLRR